MSDWNPVILPEFIDKYKQALTWVDFGLKTKYKSIAYNPAEIGTLGAGVMACASGELLCLFYSSIYWDNQENYNLALNSLEKLIVVTDKNSSGSFASGLPGLLWTLYHLENTDIVSDAGSMIDDEVINHYCQIAIEKISDGDYDFMHGGLGMALPLLESKRRTENQNEYLTGMVDALYHQVQFDSDQAFLCYKGDLEKPDEKYISFGMAHGLSGIIAILSKIYLQNIATARCKELIEKFVNLIISKKLENKYSCLFPPIYKAGSTASHNGFGRISWCTGDIDMAFALFHAFNALKIKSYKEEADNIIDYILTHNVVNTQYTFEGSFCHGACGNGHMFSRLYNYTGNEALAEAARYWFRIAYEKIKFENNALKISTGIKNEKTWSGNTNVIMGIAGLGLTLLSAIAEVTPDWDDMFLLRI